MPWNFPILTFLGILKPKTWKTVSVIEGTPPQGYHTKTIQFIRGGPNETKSAFKMTMEQDFIAKRFIKYIGKTTGNVSREDEDDIQMQPGSILQYNPGDFNDYSYYQEYTYIIQ